MRYSIVTFGCRVNQADSLRIEEDLRACGGVEAPSSAADLVIVNTCSVTATADQGARQTIRRIARENPNARIVATGCYATRCSDEVATLPNVVRVVRNDEKLDLIATHANVTQPFRPAEDRAAHEAESFRPVESGQAHVAQAFRPAKDREAHVAQVLTPAENRQAHVAQAFRPADDGPCGKAIEPGMAGRTAFTLRVQTGCEECCSYCIIPTTRGASRSVPLPDVVREVERVAAAGFKEITLTGVHLGSYGRDLPWRSSLFDLLRALEHIDADVRFRISSLEPMDCTADIVDVVAQGDRFLPHFHLPLQHASDRLLRAMRRPYTLDYYRRLVDRVHDRLPHASIGSDMIVGFPGETDADFAANLDYLPTSLLTHLHVFPYSDRPGTGASSMPGKVHGAIVRERGLALRRIGTELSRSFNASQIGTVRPGLTLEDGALVVTDNYLKVRIPNGLRRNVRVLVRIEQTSPCMFGAIVPPATSAASVQSEGVLEQLHRHQTGQHLPR